MGYTKRTKLQQGKVETQIQRKTTSDGITQDMLEKYVVYYKECYNKEKDKWREFFKVEKHPKLDKIWIGSKSNKVSILDKLYAANKVAVTGSVNE